MNACVRCGDILRGNECDCGWKKPSASTIVLKNFDYPDNNKEIQNTLAYQLSDWDKRALAEELLKNAPSLKYGATKKDVGSYWMKHIKSILRSA